MNVFDLSMALTVAYLKNEKKTYRKCCPNFKVIFGCFYFNYSILKLRI
jgi:hypothetical protein